VSLSTWCLLYEGCHDSVVVAAVADIIVKQSVSVALHLFFKLAVLFLIISGSNENKSNNNNYNDKHNNETMAMMCA
jgi:hypothetical protein